MNMVMVFHIIHIVLHLTVISAGPGTHVNTSPTTTPTITSLHNE